MLQVSNVTKKGGLLVFQNGLKPWVRQVQKERGVCENDHKDDVVDGNGNGDNDGNGKPRVRNKKSNRKI
ncbi:hypothetical protein Goari_018021, partial [Gossypium aridum]|nr:hypothetical protein [Gossypium aridum]